MPLLRLDNAGLHYGTLTLLDDVNFTLSRGEKLGLLGRNGSGKTTLLKVLSGEVALDAGERWMRPGIRLAWLQQALPEGSKQTVYDVVAEGLAETGRLLAEYHHLLQAGDLTDL
ncbi:MAG: ATP-binding cassette domain-containing protein, partial [Xanthomonadales bacterium]|nr:ATP-binding cassette domain-containing protein [Xanthomonadales bacterium]